MADSSGRRSRVRRWWLNGRDGRVYALPGWLLTALIVVSVGGLLGVGADAIAGEPVRSWELPAVATALATALLVLYTAYLFTAAISQQRASQRPLMIEVKPFAPPPADLGGHLVDDRAEYWIDFFDGKRVRWDGRRPFIAVDGTKLYVSLVIRNVGGGLAELHRGSVRVVLHHLDGRVARDSAQRTEESTLKRLVRYARLPAGETTRVNVVWDEPAGWMEFTRASVSVAYTDAARSMDETAVFELTRRLSRAWNARLPGGSPGPAWHVTAVVHR